MTSVQQEYQRSFYNRHFPKRAAAVRSQLAHPLFRSFNDRVAARVLDLCPAPSGDNGRDGQHVVRVYEPGCGEGLVGSALERVAAARGLALSYTGADLSEAALDLARSSVSGDLRVGDAMEVTTELPAASHDVVLAKNLLHHLDDPAGFLRATSRVLRPGGLLVAFEPRLGSPQMLVFNLLAPRRERHFFRGQRRNRAAFGDAGYRVAGVESFSWLPYELAFVIKPELFRRLFSVTDERVIRRVSRLDDLLARRLRWLASYAVWVATPDGAADDSGSGTNSV